MLWAHIGNASDMMGMHGWYYSGSQEGDSGAGKRSVALGIGSASASDSMDVNGRYWRFVRNRQCCCSKKTQ